MYYVHNNIMYTNIYVYYPFLFPLFSTVYSLLLHSYMSRLHPPQHTLNSIQLLSTFWCVFLSSATDTALCLAAGCWLMAESVIYENEDVVNTNFLSIYLT